MGSGKIISDAERTVLNTISGVDLSANNYTTPLATTTVSGAIIVGDRLSVNNGILNSSGAEHFAGSGITLTNTTFSVNTNDLSDNIALLTEDQNVNGVKTFTENIIANISGNATSVTNGLTTSSDITSFNDISSMGSGKIISDSERNALNNISGIHTGGSYTLTTASGDTLGGVVIGDKLSVDASGTVSYTHLTLPTIYSV